MTGIILAAGEGRRMGRVKQLLPLKGKTVLECVVDCALASALDRVIVVLGHQADSIALSLAGEAVVVVVNPGYASGQSSSLKAGLKLVDDDAEAVLFLLGDQPLVTPGTIDRILSAYSNSGCPIVYPVFSGKRGNPVLFSRKTFGRIMALTGDCGARSLIEAYAGEVLPLQVSDPGVIMDMDTEEEYSRLLRFWSAPICHTPI